MGRIGCDLSNQCRNYKFACHICACNWELDDEERVGCDDLSDDCNEEDDEQRTRLVLLDGKSYIDVKTNDIYSGEFLNPTGSKFILGKEHVRDTNIDCLDHILDTVKKLIIPSSKVIVCVLGDDEN